MNESIGVLLVSSVKNSCYADNSYYENLFLLVCSSSLQCCTEHKLMCVCVCLFVCLQVLTLSQTTIGRISIGHVINLASNDVHRYDLVCSGL